MDLKELQSDVNPQEHWYYQTKKSCLLKFFKEKITGFKKVTVIDIGAGSGFFSLELYRLYPEKINKIILVDINYTENEIVETQGKFIQKMQELPSTVENSFIIMMDVLEHIEDDQMFLEQLKIRIMDKSYCFITVPAFQELYSGHDVFLGHYRRYTLRQLQNILRAQGFLINKSYYQYGLIFPIVYVLRKLNNKPNIAKNDMKSVNPIINSILYNIIGLEMQITHFNKNFGLTCTVELTINGVSKR